MYLAAAHDRDAVGHRQRFFLVVRDEHERDADLALNPLELYLHRLAQLEIQCGKRLVEQEHGRAVDQGPGERDALALPAGQLVGLSLSRPVSWTSSSISPTRCLISALATLRRRSPNATFSQMDR